MWWVIYTYNIYLFIYIYIYTNLSGLTCAHVTVQTTVRLPCVSNNIDKWDEMEWFIDEHEHKSGRPLGLKYNYIYQ